MLAAAQSSFLGCWCESYELSTSMCGRDLDAYSFLHRACEDVRSRVLAWRDYFRRKVKLARLGSATSNQRMNAPSANGSPLGAIVIWKAKLL